MGFLSLRYCEREKKRKLQYVEYVAVSKKNKKEGCKYYTTSGLHTVPYPGATHYSTSVPRTVNYLRVAYKIRCSIDTLHSLTNSQAERL